VQGAVPRREVVRNGGDRGPRAMHARQLLPAWVVSPATLSWRALLECDRPEFGRPMFELPPWQCVCLRLIGADTMRPWLLCRGLRGGGMR
jgi:hypothetical protein